MRRNNKNNGKARGKNRAEAYKTLSRAALLAAALIAASALLLSRIMLDSLENKLIPLTGKAETAARRGDAEAAAKTAGEIAACIEKSEKALRFIIGHNDIFDLRRMAEEAKALFELGETKESVASLIGLRSLVSMLSECGRVSLGNIF